MIKSWLIVSAASFFLELFGVSWDSVDEKIAEEFPGVAMLETSELQAQLRSAATPAPVLVDVREANEYRVSHLQSALNLQSAQDIAARFPDPDTEIVVYCSVGYRSAAVARELESLGYVRVHNLRHSIFAWANQGLPLVNANGATDKVHPFNRAWGSLLEKSRHQYPQ
ncbi:MAG: rhodanese-like domain-containing protein [Pseudomonadales bacterium]|nr:rhodanese-like domain-containing protein [Pseudomonadales bacterium]